MKMFCVTSASEGSLFEAKTNDLDSALVWFDDHNTDGHTTVVRDDATGEVLLQGEDGETTYIEPHVLLKMLHEIGQKDPETGFMLGILTLLSGVLD